MAGAPLRQPPPPFPGSRWPGWIAVPRLRRSQQLLAAVRVLPLLQPHPPSSTNRRLACSAASSSWRWSVYCPSSSVSNMPRSSSSATRARSPQGNAHPAGPRGAGQAAGTGLSRQRASAAAASLHAGARTPQQPAADCNQHPSRAAPVWQWAASCSAAA